MSNATNQTTGAASGKLIGRTFEYGTRRPASCPKQGAASGKLIGRATAL